MLIEAGLTASLGSVFHNVIANSWEKLNLFGSILISGIVSLFIIMTSGNSMVQSNIVR